MVRRYVRSRNLVNEEALAHWGLLRQIKKKKLKHANNEPSNDVTKQGNKHANKRINKSYYSGRQELWSRTCRKDHK